MAKREIVSLLLTEMALSFNTLLVLSSSSGLRITPLIVMRELKFVYWLTTAQISVVFVGILLVIVTFVYFLLLRLRPSVVFSL